MLIPLFVLQVLTLALGAVSIILRKRILSFALALLSLLVMTLMIAWARYYLENALSEYNLGYQLGYYLVYFSVILFLSVFALNEVMKRVQTTKSTKEHPNSISSTMNNTR